MPQQLNRKKLQAAIAASPLTARQVAALAGVSLPTVESWKYGVHQPKIENLTATARVLGITVEDLCDEVEAPSPDAALIPGGTR